MVYQLTTFGRVFSFHVIGLHAVKLCTITGESNVGYADFLVSQT